MATIGDERPALQDVLSPPPDLRGSDLRREIERSIAVLGWLRSIEPSDLTSSSQPEVGEDLVTVVVPMFRAGRWIDACLRGLLAQTHRNLEIFCVDDHGGDDTYDRVVDHFGRDRRLCVIELARNVGPFQIRNWIGGVVARGRRLVWQDADNVSHPTRIEAQGRWMSRHGYAICGTAVHHCFPPDIEPLCGGPTVVEPDGTRHELIYYRSVSRAHEPGPPAEDPAELEERGWQRNELDAAGLAKRGIAADVASCRRAQASMHGSQMLDTALFRELGGFYGRTKLGEDNEFDWRVTRFHDLGNLPTVLGSRFSHRDSLMFSAETGMQSAARQRYREFKAAKQAAVDAELARGNAARARELCTETLHRAEITIARAHLGFDVAL